MHGVDAHPVRPRGLAQERVAGINEVAQGAAAEDAGALENRFALFDADADVRAREVAAAQEAGSLVLNGIPISIGIVFP